MVVRDTVTAVRQLNFIPIFEAMGARRIGMKLENRHCRRTASNRGVCVYEHAVVQAGTELDSHITEVEEEEGRGGNWSRSTKVSFVSTLPRPALPCKSDNEACLKILRSLNDACNARLQRNELDGTGVPVTGLEEIGHV